MQKYLVGILKESKNPTRATKLIGSYQHLFKFQDIERKKSVIEREEERERMKDRQQERYENRDIEKEGRDRERDMREKNEREK